MSPEHGEAGGTTRLRLADGRWAVFRLEPETWQLYYGGARRDEASEREERAGLAEMIASQAGPVGPAREPDTEEESNVYFLGAALYVGMQEALKAGADEIEAVERAIEADPAVLGGVGTDAVQAAAGMARVEEELRRHHPDFDGTRRGERIELLRLGARRMDEAWRALDAFAGFVQGGRVEGRSKRTPPDPQLDVRASELKDALGLTNREIGEILGVPRTQTDVRQGGHRKVGHTIERGRKLLTDNLGEDGYRRHIEAVSSDLRHRHYLGGRERLVLRLIELTAGLTGRSAEETEAMGADFQRLVEKHFPEA